MNWLIQSGSFREAHNEYLQIWEELGLLGLVFFLVLLFWPLVSAVPLLLRTQDPRTSYWIGVLCLSLVFVSVSCLSFFPFHVSLTTAYVALLFACLRHFENQERTGLETARPLMVWKLVSFFALAAWLAYPHVLKWRANNEMGLAAEILEGVAVSDLRPQQRWLLASVALRRLDRAERFYPRFYEIYNLKGSAFLILGQPEEALRYYQKALPHLPSPELFTNLAAVHLAQRRFEQARSLLELALKYNPAYERARRALDLVKANER